MLGDTGTTWDINPQFDPTHPLYKNFEWVTIPDLNVRVPKPFVEEFLKDPTDCKTKYMCHPHLRSVASSRFPTSWTRPAAAEASTCPLDASKDGIAVITAGLRDGKQPGKSQAPTVRRSAPLAMTQRGLGS